MKTLGQHWVEINTWPGFPFSGTSPRQVRTHVIVRSGHFDIELIASALEQTSRA